MRFSEAWLREWVNPDISTTELSDQLSMAGLEVDSVEPAAASFSGVVIGEVLTKGPHPDADKLSVCSVDVGDDYEPLQIVCGARNVEAGMKVPVAMVGAKLPGDFEIKKAKLRGVKSMGMICSASELGLAESSDGIMPLPEKSPLGEDFRDYLSLDDQCIEVDLTPDRGDCLSLAGIAREVSVINESPLSEPDIKAIFPVIDDTFPVELEAPEACPRYSCLIIKGINAKAETPEWMVEKLRRSGIRSLGPVVDVTNYVMIELGQPMHAFDLAKLDSRIRVRMAEKNEPLTLLDGSEVKLDTDTLVIADASKPLALAGIMGGEGSGVTESTTAILLESAFFSPQAIIGDARKYGLHTDSSHRFERGVDPDLQIKALERAAALLHDVVGGDPGPVVEVKSEDYIPKQLPILLRRDQIARVLGIELTDESVVRILKDLGMQVESIMNGWRVTPPSSRFDIAIEVDLIEEIGRIHGYNNIPENLSSAPVSIQSKPEENFRLSVAKQMLVDRDYQEAITYSFISPEIGTLLNPDEDAIKLANPISSDMSVMRASLWPGLLGALKNNLGRQQERVRLFESGLTFKRDKVSGDLKQEPYLAGLVYGPQVDEQWGSESRDVDFYDLKGDLVALLGQVYDAENFIFSMGEHSALHPGQTAEISLLGQSVGMLGLLHPQLQAQLDITKDVYLFEISINNIEKGAIPAYHPISKFPAIRRDLAITVAKDVEYQAVEDCISDAAPEIVRDIRLFDVYTGDKIDSGLKSYALTLILQEYSRTLTDQEVEEATEVILSALKENLSAHLRE